MKYDQANTCPTPGPKSIEKFAYFFRPYNFKIHTRKFMDFEGIAHKDEDYDKREELGIFEYVDYVSKMNEKQEQIIKIKEAEEE